MPEDVREPHIEEFGEASADEVLGQQCVQFAVGDFVGRQGGLLDLSFRAAASPQEIASRGRNEHSRPGKPVDPGIHPGHFHRPAGFFDVRLFLGVGKQRTDLDGDRAGIDGLPRIFPDTFVTQADRQFGDFVFARQERFEDIGLAPRHPPAVKQLWIS